MRKKIFSSYKYKNFPLPNLLEVQINSYHWFLKKGLAELFEEISPIGDYTGANLELSFGNYYFDEPKYSQSESKDHFTSYEAPLRVKARLKNKRTNEIKEQEVYLGDFPLMTSRGTFIINGVERVIVSQLIRSSGVFFTLQNTRNKNQFGAKIIPNRGAWLEFETDYEGVISVKIDRKRKVPITSLLRIFGLTEDSDIIAAFSQYDAQTDPVSAKEKKAGLVKSLINSKNDSGLREDLESVSYIKSTLAKDPAKTAGEAYIEIYKRIRPGDLATVENAKSLIDAMFAAQRYDISEVGRWKMESRLRHIRGAEAAKLKNLTDEKDLNKSFGSKVMHLADIVAIISEIIRLNNEPHAKPDDIDHLGNRRVRAMGELVQQRLRLGLARLERIAKDRMSTLDAETITPAQLINARPLMAIIKEFFSSSQLSQFMDQVNPLAELEHKRRLSALGPGGLARERAGFEVRDVHTSHYGRICPIQTPEGPNIGLVEYFSSYARLNDFGFIETPYRVVKNGRVTDEFKHLNALEEEDNYIAHGGSLMDETGKLLEEFVQVRHKTEPTLVERDKVNLMDVSPQQIISISTSLIPFLEHDDANRALMGSNMQRQAVPCVKPQVPLVGTGTEERAVQDSGYVILAEEDGVVEAVDGRRIRIKYVKPVKDKMQHELKMLRTETAKDGGEIVEYKLHNFVRSNQYTSLNQFPRVEKTQKIKKGDVLADGISTEDGALALGQNLTVAFMSWRGGNFEDAIILSEKMVQQDIFSSIHIESYSLDVRETKLGPEITTPDIPNVSEEKLKDLDEEGIVHIGAELGQGDILVGKISPKGEADLTAEERLLRAIFGEKARDVKDASLHLPHGKMGRVVGIKIFERDKGDKLPAGVIKTIQVEVAEYRKVSVGDKLAGRHGNKGVISMILPEEEMPYMEDGRSVDVILNPLGVASRMNIGQILETHLGWAMKAQGLRAVTPALAGATEAEIRAELKSAGLSEDGKMTLYDGQTGEPFDQKVTVGVIYIMKLNHLVEDKIHMRSIGPYSLITQQPLGGKAQFGGQRFGEMEVWALEGYGAAYTLQEMLTIKSDDVVGRGHAYESIIKGEPIRTPNIPASFFVLVNEMKGLGLNVDLISAEVGPPVEFKEEIRAEARAET